MPGGIIPDDDDLDSMKELTQRIEEEKRREKKKYRIAQVITFLIWFVFCALSLFMIHWAEQHDKAKTPAPRASTTK